jgi:hypothetical protein
MTEGTDGTDLGSSDSKSRGSAAEPEAIAAVGAYEEGDDVVLYDTENPLAWVQAGTSVDIAEMV